MLPTALLVALMPCAAPPLDKSATAQDATELLRGRWVVVYRETNGRPTGPKKELIWEFEGRKLTAYILKDEIYVASARLVHDGGSYELLIMGAGIEGRGQLNFRGAEFIWFSSYDPRYSFWARR